MLKSLEFTHVGPATRMEFGPLAQRFNLITGDNGLGKSFLLEAAWFALTRTWHESPIVPSAPDARMRFVFDGEKKTIESDVPWDRLGQRWKLKAGRPANPGLVIYARVDGSFSVWDPARNYRVYTQTDGGGAQSPSSYQFPSSASVLEGLRRTVPAAGAPRVEVLCRGLIDDWTRWQEAGAPEFDLLKRLLQHLGADGHPLEPGKPFAPSLDDARLIPTIRMPYGQEVPITYCPAGVRRVCQLAYLLAWTFSQHRTEATRIGQPLARQVIVLLDEPETHLHPRWQRTVLPSLANAVEHWNDEHAPEVQFFVASHSPLVLVSLEPVFDPSRDALWKLDMREGSVCIAKDAWEPRGDAERWLLSDVFDMTSTAPPVVEQLLEQASRVMMDPRPSPEVVARLDEELGRRLPAMDPFLFRWRHYMMRDVPAKGIP